MIDSYKNKGQGFANFFFRLMGYTFSVVHNCAVVVLEQTIYKQITWLFSNKILFRKRWPTVGHSLLSSDIEQLISYF